MALEKTTGFIGFPDKKMKQVIIPDHFFTDLLPQIDNMAELKLTLHCFWLLNEQSGELRYLRGDDLRSDEKLLVSLTLDNDLRAPKMVLEDALSRAVAEERRVKVDQELPPFDGEPLLEFIGEIEFERASVGQHFEVQDVVVPVVNYIDDALAICAHGLLEKSRRTACTEGQ